MDSYTSDRQVHSPLAGAVYRHPNTLAHCLRALLGALLAVPPMAMAATILNPGNIADPNGVSAFVISPDFEFTDVTENITQTGDIQDGTLRIGQSFAAGALEVNADTEPNTVTSLFNIADLEVGNFGRDGTLTVRGNGNPGSAQITAKDEFRLGANANATVSILNGGQIVRTGPEIGRAGTAFFGSFNSFQSGSGDTAVTVDGADSLLEINGRLDVGFNNITGTDDLTISNGGQVVVKEPDNFSDRVEQSGDIGENSSGDFVLGSGFEGGAAQPTDTLTVTGTGSELVVSSGLFTSAANSVINVLDGGVIRQDEQGNLAAELDAFPTLNPETFGGLSLGSPFPTSELNISGDGSEVSFTRGIRLGGLSRFAGFDASGDPIFAPGGQTTVIENGGRLETTRQIFVSDAEGEGTGALRVASGGTVAAERINIFEGGLLTGDGGSLEGDVVVDGGTLAPGDSPGSLDIIGDLSLDVGLLELEFGDLLKITGDLVLGETLDISLSFMDEPVGDSIDLASFFEVEGTIESQFDAGSNLGIDGLADGSQLAVFDLSGERVVFGAGATVPAPSTLLLAGIGFLSLVRIANRRTTRKSADLVHRASLRG